MNFHKKQIQTNKQILLLMTPIFLVGISAILAMAFHNNDTDKNIAPPAKQSYEKLLKDSITHRNPLHIWEQKQK